MTKMTRIYRTAIVRNHDDDNDLYIFSDITERLLKTIVGRMVEKLHGHYNVTVFGYDADDDNDDMTLYWKAVEGDYEDYHNGWVY